jgi:hypothetical protein
MHSAKDHPNRRSSDGSRESTTDHPGQESRAADSPGEHDLDESASVKVGTISHDAKGNRVWEWPSKLLRRRVDDQAIDYVKVLGGEDLSLSKEEQPAKKHWWRFWARKTPVDRSKELAA